MFSINFEDSWNKWVLLKRKKEKHYQPWWNYHHTAAWSLPHPTPPPKLLPSDLLGDLRVDAYRQLILQRTRGKLLSEVKTTVQNGMLPAVKFDPHNVTFIRFASTSPLRPISHLSMTFQMSQQNWSNLSQHSQQLDSDIAPDGVQTFCSQLSKHSFARRANVMLPRSFLLRAAAFLLETFQLNIGCSGFCGRFPWLNSAAEKCFGPTNALHGVIRQLRSRRRPQYFWTPPRPHTSSWSPRFSNSDRKDRQLNPKRKAAVLIAW